MKNQLGDFLQIFVAFLENMNKLTCFLKLAHFRDVSTYFPK